MEVFAASIGFIMIFAFVGKVIAIAHIGFKGNISPANYEHRILSNGKRLKIQLHIPYFLFFNKWEDYQTATSIRAAMNHLYRTHWFTSIEEAEEYVEKCKEQQIQKRKDNDFTII